MSQSNRTPGQAEGTEEDVRSALNENQQPRRAGAAGERQSKRMEQEPGTTPEQAEGTEEQAEGALRHQK